MARPPKTKTKTNAEKYVYRIQCKILHSHNMKKKSKNERKSHNPTIFYALCVSGFIVELCSMQS